MSDQDHTQKAAPRMDEAEAALWVLGTVLGWKDMQTPSTPCCAYADVNDGVYRIEVSPLLPAAWKAVHYCDKSCLYSHADGFNAPDEAKAACECHYATGHWK